MNKIDPTGTECVLKEKALTCTIKISVEKGQKLTSQQYSQARRLVANYTQTVAKLLKSGRVATVGATGGRAGTSFKISARNVAAALANREVVFRPGTSNGKALMDTGGWNPHYPGGKQFTNVFSSAQTLSDRQQQHAFTHEGIHHTREEFGGHGFATALGSEPFQTEHQDPYNEAADELLGN